MVTLPSRGGQGGLFQLVVGVLCLIALLVPPVRAQSGPLYVISSQHDRLGVVDPLTGHTLSSVTIALPGRAILGAAGLARNPLNGDIFALLALSDQGSQRELVRINPSTGEAEDVGNT